MQYPVFARHLIEPHQPVMKFLNYAVSESHLFGHPNGRCMFRLDDSNYCSRHQSINLRVASPSHTPQTEYFMTSGSLRVSVAEPGVNVSAHRASIVPTIYTRTEYQCGNKPGCFCLLADNHASARVLCPLKRLYFLMAHRSSNASRCSATA